MTVRNKIRMTPSATNAATDHNTTPTAAPKAGDRQWWRLVAGAILAAGVLDAAFAFVLYVLISHRFNFETLLQWIASGVAGDAAFASGWAGIGYAAIGFTIHMALAAGFVAVYAVLVAPRVRTRSMATVAGLVYGVGIWVFMNTAVLPLGRSTREAFLSANYLLFLLDHAVLVGLPIALILSRVGQDTRR